MISSCSFYHLSPLNSIIGTSQNSTASISDEISHVSLQSTVTPSAIPPASENIISKVDEEPRIKSITTLIGPSSCWIDLNHHRYAHLGKMDLGRWSAPTWRRHRSIFSQAKFDTDQRDLLYTPTRWQRLLREGIYIGYEDVGFRLKFGLE